jgi:Mrp family chromosome partitioning ATPase/uncharacterized protein involved in exopolysaccharide biosynthesis
MDVDPATRELTAPTEGAASAAPAASTAPEPQPSDAGESLVGASAAPARTIQKVDPEPAAEHAAGNGHSSHGHSGNGHAPSNGHAVASTNGHATAAVAAPAKPPFDIYQESLRALRGRYRLAIALALLGALAGAAVGYLLKTPLYRSTGLLRIAYTLPPVMQETDQNLPISMFPGYMRAQSQVIRSRRIAEVAVETSIWQSAVAPYGGAGVGDFIDGLDVELPGESDHLRVVFEHSIPDVAAAGVNAAIEAYKRSYDSTADAELKHRLELLRNQKQVLDQKVAQIQAQLESVTRDVGAAELETRYANAVDRLHMLQSRRAEVSLAIASVPDADSPPSTQPSASGSLPAEITVERIARNDPQMARLLSEKERVEEDLERVRRRFGYRDAHPEVVERLARLEQLQQRIEKCAADYRALETEIAQQVTPINAASTGTIGSIAVLHAQQPVIERLYEQANQDVLTLGAKRQHVAQLTTQGSKLDAELDAVEQRLRNLQLEAGLGGRLSVINPGEIPVRVFYDPRKKYALAGAVAGAGMPVALLVLVGLLGSKYRFSHETEVDVARSAPLLGILPTLPEDLTDRPEAVDAAHCVHQIRVMLEMKRQAKGQGVYLITSACPGEGKTSVAVALGLSFVASGRKTLLIDCDLVGRGITHGFRADGSAGVRESLSAGTARGLVKRSPSGLRLLTAGSADTFSGWTLSSVALARLVSQARRHYDVVLIDSGPILGSVEASVIAPEVDGAIMVIARGQQRALVDRAMRHLGSLHASVIGFVFNRANSSDFKRAAFHSSAREIAGSGAANEAPLEEASDVTGFGPLVRSVARFLRPHLAARADS